MAAKFRKYQDVEVFDSVLGWYPATFMRYESKRGMPQVVIVKVPPSGKLVAVSAAAVR